MRKNRSIKPKIRWKAKKSPNVWQGQHQALEVLQALISLTQEITGPRDSSPAVSNPGKLFRGFFNTIEQTENASRTALVPLGLFYAFSLRNRQWENVAPDKERSRSPLARSPGHASRRLLRNRIRYRQRHGNSCLALCVPEILCDIHYRHLVCAASGFDTDGDFLIQLYGQLMGHPCGSNSH